MSQSPLGLHLPDADHLTPEEVQACLDLRPSAALTLCYAQWDGDKGLASDVKYIVRTLGHARLYVRFHADPNPVRYASNNGGPYTWGALCALRAGQYYGPLSGLGVQLHAILANEIDAEPEGGLRPADASVWFRQALAGYSSVRPQDILHIPATTGSPESHRAYLEQYIRDGWVRPDYWIDGHGYNGDLGAVVNTIRASAPGQAGYVITESNDVSDFTWPTTLCDLGIIQDYIYFILNWARGGEGRIQPPSPDDAAKRMSLLRFPDRYNQFKATVITMPINEPDVWKPYAQNLCDLKGIPWNMYDKQIETESGWRQYRPDGTVLTSPTGSKGLGQINSNFFPPEKWSTPLANLDFSTDLMASHYKAFGSWRKALAAYNWGPGNVGGYTDKSGNVHPAWDGTRDWTCPVGLPQCRTEQRNHYLDLILGEGWPEPGDSTVDFIVGPGIASKMAEAGDSPATHEMYVSHGDENMYSHAYGTSGAQYVYIFSLNQTFRFQPD